MSLETRSVCERAASSTPAYQPAPFARVVSQRNMFVTWNTFLFSSFLRWLTCYISSTSSRKMGLRGVSPKDLMVRCRKDRHAREQVVKIMHTKKAGGCYDCALPTSLDRSYTRPGIAPLLVSSKNSRALDIGWLMPHWPGCYCVPTS